MSEWKEGARKMTGILPGTAQVEEKRKKGGRCGKNGPSLPVKGGEKPWMRPRPKIVATIG
jgi:hypothetical protein